MNIEEIRAGILPINERSIILIKKLHFKYIGKNLPEKGGKLLQLKAPKSKNTSKLTLEGMVGQMGNAFDKFGHKNVFEKGLQAGLGELKF